MLVSPVKTRTKVITTIFLLSVFAFLFTPMAPIGSQIWPAPADMGASSAQVGLLILYTAISSLGFGIGVAFLIWGYPYVKKVFNKTYAPWVFFGVFWMTWSWWIHDIGHMTTHGSVAWLLVLEYVFHATNVLFGGVIALAFVKGRRK